MELTMTNATTHLTYPQSSSIDAFLSQGFLRSLFLKKRNTHAYCKTIIFSMPE